MRELVVILLTVCNFNSKCTLFFVICVWEVFFKLHEVLSCSGGCFDGC